MKIQISKINFSVIIYPSGEPRSSKDTFVIEASPEEEALIADGGPFLWIPDDPEKPEGSGKLTKIDQSAPSAVQQLDIARAGMSTLIASLPVESRAKFASPRAGIEKLLDVGDIEAAHYGVGQIESETPEEEAVKQTILGALVGFLPA